MLNSDSADQGELRVARALRTTRSVSFWGYLGQGLSILAVPLYLKYLGADGYGLMLTALAFIGYLSFADPGLSWGASVLMAQSYGRGEMDEFAHILRHAIIVAMGSAMVSALALIIYYLTLFPEGHIGGVRGENFGNLIVLVGIQAVANLVAAPFYNTFNALQEGYKGAMIQGGGRVVSVIAVVVAARLSGSTTVALAAGVFVYLLATVAVVIYVIKCHRWAFRFGSVSDGNQYKKQVSAGVKNFGLQIARVLYGSLPIFIIGSVLGVATVPLYTIALSGAALLFLPFGSYSASMQAAVGEAYGKGDRAWIASSICALYRSTLLFGFVSLVLIVLVGSLAIPLWTGGLLRPTLGVLFSVGILSGIHCLSGVSACALLAANRHKRLAFIEILHALLAAAAIWVGVKSYGLAGVGCGAALAYLGFSSWLVARELELQLGIKGLLPGAVWWIKVGFVVLPSLLFAFLLVAHVRDIGLVAVLSACVICYLTGGLMLTKLVDLGDLKRRFLRIIA